MSSEKFTEAQFMRDLVNLKDTQESIQNLSAWCIRNRKYAYKIARDWLKVMKKVKPDKKLVLFHLINDIVQHSKRKNVTDLIEKCKSVLKEAMPYLKEDEAGPKVAQRVIRVIKIWEERCIFDDTFLNNLKALMDPNSENDAQQEILDNFQPQQLCTQLKIIKALEDDTDYKQKQLKSNDIDLIDVENLRQNLKDREHGNDFINDFEEGRKKMEHYIKALDKEITKRRQVIELLTHAGKYYDNLMSEANIVVNAYSNFGKRITNVETKLDTKLVQLQAKQSDLESISPIPSPDYDAPSPTGNDDMELELPDDSAPEVPIKINEKVDYQPQPGRHGSG